MELIYAAPQAGEVAIDGRTVRALDLQGAIDKASPGDTVLLVADTYLKPVTLTKSGEPGHLITIVGAGRHDAVLDGGRCPSAGCHAGLCPSASHWAMVRLENVSHIVFQNLKVENCWPHAFCVSGCSDITFRDLKATGSRRLIFACDSERQRTRGLLLEKVTWVQDPDHSMWTGEATWKQVKAKPGAEDKSWFNGALFESVDIEGDVTIRDCHISHAFNGIRMDIDKGCVQRGPGGPTMASNRNVRIYRNTFSFIRDNAIEPEVGLQSWLVAENRFFQVHAALSLDAVAIRDLTFVANQLLNVSRPADASNTSGKIVKFLDPDDSKTPSESVNFVSAFNSMRTRTRYAADADLKPWLDVNNAVERLAADYRDDRLLFSRVRWIDDAHIVAMITNDCGFPSDYVAHGAKIADGRTSPRIFQDPYFDGDLNAPLGGWSGELLLASAACGADASSVTLMGPNGARKTVPAGHSRGYQSVKALGLGSWLE